LPASGYVLRKGRHFMSVDGPLPEPKKPVKFTPAALRIMQMCEKAFASNNFLLLYFSNRKTFNQMFNEPGFKEVLRNRFQFLQLRRADKAGNWLTTTFHVKCSPYFAIIDPSNGQFLTIAYGDMTIPDLRNWLRHFLATSPAFALPQTIFRELIDEAAKIKLKASFASAAKIRVHFVGQTMDEKIVYVNRAAPLELAFEKFCSEKGIDINAHYFLFKGVELPGNMSASQFALRNGSVVNVHPLEDKTSAEPLSIAVVNVDGSSAVFNVTRGKKLGVFLKSYCEMTQLIAAQVRFTFNNEVVNEDLTFAEHDMKNGDHLYAHFKPAAPANDYMYHMMNPMEMPAMPPMPLQQQYEMPIPNLMFLYNQGQVPRPPLPSPFAPPPPGFPPAPGPFPMPPAKGMHPHYQSKPHDPNLSSSIWESFDMP
jgi:hypothetical protein